MLFVSFIVLIEIRYLIPLLSSSTHFAVVALIKTTTSVDLLYLRHHFTASRIASPLVEIFLSLVMNSRIQSNLPLKNLAATIGSAICHHHYHH